MSAADHLRADIQGLRAVAVLVVIAAHARLGPTSGGFVGVDVFFVISGFLITQLLVREFEESGSVSLFHFYGRRARRILPAATLVLLATAAGTALWLGVAQVSDALRDITWSAFFVLNLRLAREGTDYFGQDLPPSPVQHFWSLAVEEQFYLLWPAIILIVLVIARRLSALRNEPPYRALMGSIAGISCASFVWSVVQTGADPDAAYFSTLTRAWELGAGATAAIWLAQRAEAPSRRTRLTAELGAAAGLIAILVACLVYDEATAFPGWRAALPVLGALMFLSAGGVASVPPLAARLVSARPLTLIGDWSYSLYLWHWPVLLVAPYYLGHPLSGVERALAVLLTLVLAALTYRFIENPFRRAGWSRRPWRTVTLYPVTVILVASACLAASMYTDTHRIGDGAPIALGQHWRAAYKTTDPAVALVAASIRAAREGHPIPKDLQPALTDVRDSVASQGDCNYEFADVRRLCAQGDPGADRTIVLFGNSHARHWIPALERIGRDYGYRTYYLAKVQCIGSLVTPTRDGKPFDDCVDFHDWALKEIAKLRPDLVLVSTSASTNGGLYEADGSHVTDGQIIRPMIRQGYVRLLQALTSYAGRTVLLPDIPYLNRDPTTCIGAPGATLKNCLLQPRSAQATVVSDQVAAAREVGADVVPTSQWFCVGRVCPSVVGSYLPRRDAGHMTNEYSAHLADSLAADLGLR